MGIRNLATRQVLYQILEQVTGPQALTEQDTPRSESPG